jgi:hypothetical protein
MVMQCEQDRLAIMVPEHCTARPRGASLHNPQTARAFLIVILRIQRKDPPQVLLTNIAQRLIPSAGTGFRKKVVLQQGARAG